MNPSKKLKTAALMIHCVQILVKWFCKESMEKDFVEKILTSGSVGKEEYQIRKVCSFPQDFNFEPRRSVTMTVTFKYQEEEEFGFQRPVFDAVNSRAEYQTARSIIVPIVRTPIE